MEDRLRAAGTNAGWGPTNRAFELSTPDARPLPLCAAGSRIGYSNRSGLSASI